MNKYLITALGSLALAGAVAVPMAQAAPAAVSVTHAKAAPPPPATVYRLEQTGDGQCAYDNGHGIQYTLGGCNSAARFTRSHCGNRGTNPVRYYCQLTDGSGQALTDLGIVVAGNPVAAATQLWSDVYGGKIYNWAEVQNGSNSQRLDGPGSNGGLFMSSAGANWAYLAG